MKKLQVVLILCCLSIVSAKAQNYFLGKSEKTIMDSLFKTNYRQFEGQVIPGERYLITFRYDDLQDSAYVKKLESSNPPILPITDSITYSFVFDHVSCVSYRIFHKNLTDYQKVVLDLNSHFTKKSNSDVWVDGSGQIEIVLTKPKFKTDFIVDFHRP